MDRRQFLCLLGSGLCGCAATVAYQGRLEQGRVLVPLAELPAEFSEKGYALVRAARLDDPILIHRTGTGEFRALSARCTHLGCQVWPARNALICPCHGSSFSWEGEVIRGPAQKPLPRYLVAVKEETLEITID
ncbi:MAG: Rieske (2Fe-2S) protein [Candidatus Latescibacteria bacterium]|nr:Rieske (2Fe-2S) protein [Candidatus Latescibacterota bacterium]